MTVKTYQPQCQVFVVKRIERRDGVAKRVSSANRFIDLTPLLGDGCSVTTTKNTRAPAGTFSVSFTDQVDQRQGAAMDSLFGLLETMDYVEIRMSRRPSSTQKLPIVMRGFVSDIRRSEEFANGRPQRRLTISGHDYGKVPQLVTVGDFRADYKNSKAYQTSFPQSLLNGFGLTYMPAEDWMEITVKKILNRWLTAMVGVFGFTDGQGGVGSIPLLATTDPTLDGDKSTLIGAGAFVAPLGMQPFEGTAQSFIDTWSDKVWNETFVEDRELGPVMVYRPIPWRDAVTGKYILGTNALEMGLELTDKDIFSISLSRSDANVANYYWVNAPRSELLSGDALTYQNIQALYAGDVVIEGYPNCDPNLYGLRKMVEDTNQGYPGGNAEIPAAGTETVLRAWVSHQTRWQARRRQELIALNKDNSVFESGTLKVIGDERLRIGRYLNCTRGSLASSYYVTGVTHEFLPLRSFTTSLQVERGTGFLNRTNSQGSPAYKEGARGPYDE